MKVLLNKFDDPNVSECIWIDEGDIVIGRCNGEEFHITEGKLYKVLDTNCIDCILIENDIGETDMYSVEYFSGSSL
jgi:hypothetical protein